MTTSSDPSRPEFHASEVFLTITRAPGPHPMVVEVDTFPDAYLAALHARAMSQRVLDEKECALYGVPAEEPHCHYDVQVFRSDVTWYAYQWQHRIAEVDKMLAAMRHPAGKGLTPGDPPPARMPNTTAPSIHAGFG